jgi:aldehyde:ferredoxin oxidoreductase
MSPFKYVLLDVNLTSRKIEKKVIPDEIIKKYIGGSGLGAYELFYNTDILCDPLGPNNVLLFLAGPLTGTICPSSGRHGVVAKSPLTGIWGEANVGGKWGRELRRAGWSGVKITGAASELVYLWINDETIEIRSAEKISGMDTFETEEALKELTHSDVKVSCIGPAGERVNLLAGIFTDGYEARSAARCGLGAVMGSKKLKAIAVRGTGKPFVYDESGLRRYVKNLMPDFSSGTKRLKEKGTPSLVTIQEDVGSFPIKNFQMDSFKDHVEKISWERMKETIFVKSVNCAGCPIACGRLVQVKNKKYREEKVSGGPEYETIGMLGSNLLIDNLDAIQFANEKCNRFGIDTVETGGLIGFAMEAFDRKIIGLKDTGGVSLRWDDPDLVLNIIDSILDNRGFGKVISLGFNRLLKLWGEETRSFAPQVKGLSFPAHDPRAYNSVAVGFATSNRGACHLQAFSHVFERSVIMPEIGIYEPMDPFSYKEKGEKVALIQNLMCLFDSLSLCKFVLFGGIKVKNMAEMLSLVTGWEFDYQELIKTGERIFDVKRLFNNKCGILKSDDTLPERFLKQAKTDSEAKGNIPPLGSMLKDYYKFRMWDDRGIPEKKKLKELGIRK